MYYWSLFGFVLFTTQRQHLVVLAQTVPNGVIRCDGPNQDTVVNGSPRVGLRPGQSRRWQGENRQILLVEDVTNNNVQFLLNGQTVQDGRTFPTGQDLAWHVVATSTNGYLPFQGILLRVEASANTAIRTGNNTTLLQDAVDCLAPVLGVTNTDDSDKEALSGTLRMDQTAFNVSIHLTLVYHNKLHNDGTDGDQVTSKFTHTFASINFVEGWDMSSIPAFKDCCICGDDFQIGNPDVITTIVSETRKGPIACEMLEESIKGRNFTTDQCLLLQNAVKTGNCICIPKLSTRIPASSSITRKLIVTESTQQPQITPTSEIISGIIKLSMISMSDTMSFDVVTIFQLECASFFLSVLPAESFTAGFCGVGQQEIISMSDSTILQVTAQITVSTTTFMDAATFEDLLQNLVNDNSQRFVEGLLLIEDEITQQAFVNLTQIRALENNMSDRPSDVTSNVPSDVLSEMPSDFSSDAPSNGENTTPSSQPISPPSLECSDGKGKGKGKGRNDSDDIYDNEDGGKTKSKGKKGKGKGKKGKDKKDKGKQGKRRSRGMMKKKSSIECLMTSSSIKRDAADGKGKSRIGVYSKVETGTEHTYDVNMDTHAIMGLVNYTTTTGNTTISDMPKESDSNSGENFGYVMSETRNHETDRVGWVESEDDPRENEGVEQNTVGNIDSDLYDVANMVKAEPEAGLISEANGRVDSSDIVQPTFRIKQAVHLDTGNRKHRLRWYDK